MWFACNPQVAVLQPDRPLPKRLKPDEVWETRISVERLPASVGGDVYTLARVRLSTSQIVKSKKNENVPETGDVPGGKITGH